MVTGRTKDPILLSRFSDSYDSALSERYRLFIGFSSQRIKLTVYDPVTDQILGIEELAVDDKPAARLQSTSAALEQSQCGTNFDSVNVSFNNPYCTLIPAAVFEPDRVRQYLDLNFDADFTGTCFSEQIGLSEIYAIHHCEAALVSLIQNRYRSVNFTHFASIAIESSLREYKASGRAVFFLHPDADHMSVTVISDGELKMFNYFNFQSGADLAYYILFVADQTKIEAADIDLFLSGEVSTSDEIIDLLQQYIGNVNFYDNWEGVGLPEFFTQLEKHRYFWPVSHIRCA